MYRKLHLIIIASLLCLTIGKTFAADRSQPIELEADQVELDDNKGTSTYIGNVRLVQGNLSLQANRVIVFLKDSKIIRMQAEGTPARFKDKLEDDRQVEAEATQMDYHVSNAEIMLTGEGMLNQNGNILRNDRIHYNLTTGTLKAGGKDAEQRVKVILQPADTPP